MRFLLLHTAGAAPDASILAALSDYHALLARAGALLDGAALQPAASCAASPVAAYTLIDVRSRDEALAWADHFAQLPGAGRTAVEVRALAGPATRLPA